MSVRPPNKKVEPEFVGHVGPSDKAVDDGLTAQVPPSQKAVPTGSSNITPSQKTVSTQQSKQTSMTDAYYDMYVKQLQQKYPNWRTSGEQFEAYNKELRESSVYAAKYGSGMRTTPLSPAMQAAQEQGASKQFYEGIGYGWYGGKYAPFTIPSGMQVASMTETPSGLQIQYELTPTGFYSALGYPQYETKYKPIDVPAGYKIGTLKEITDVEGNVTLQASFIPSDPALLKQLYLEGLAYQRSKNFFESIGYGEYGGKYAAFTIPTGYGVKSITELRDIPNTPENEGGLSVEFKPTDPALLKQLYLEGLAYQRSKNFYEGLGYPQYGGKYAPITIPSGYGVQSIVETPDNPATPENEAGLSVAFTPTNPALVKEIWQSSLDYYASKRYYENLGYPQYGGKYSPMNIPTNASNIVITETPEGLQASYSLPYTDIEGQKQYGMAMQASGDFYAKLGYPQFAGKYMPFKIPEGASVSSIVETSQGLQISFAGGPIGQQEPAYLPTEYGGGVPVASHFGPPSGMTSFGVPSDAVIVGMKETEQGTIVSYQSFAPEVAQPIKTVFGQTAYWTDPFGAGSTAKMLQQAVATGIQFPAGTKLIGIETVTTGAMPGEPGTLAAGMIPLSSKAIAFLETTTVVAPVQPTLYESASIGLAAYERQQTPFASLFTSPSQLLGKSAQSAYEMRTNPVGFVTQKVLEIGGAAAGLFGPAISIGGKVVGGTVKTLITPSQLGGYIAGSIIGAQAVKSLGLQITLSPQPGQPYVSGNPSLGVDRVLTTGELRGAFASGALFAVGTAGVSYLVSGVLGSGGLIGKALAPTGFIGSVVSPTTVGAISVVSGVALRGVGMAGVGATIGYLASGGDAESAMLGGIIAGGGSVLYDVARLGVAPKIRAKASAWLTERWDSRVKETYEKGVASDTWETPKLTQTEKFVKAVTGAKIKQGAKGIVSPPVVEEIVKPAIGKQTLLPSAKGDPALLPTYGFNESGEFVQLSSAPTVGASAFEEAGASGVIGAEKPFLIGSTGKNALTALDVGWELSVQPGQSGVYYPKPLTEAALTPVQSMFEETWVYSALQGTMFQQITWKGGAMPEGYLKGAEYGKPKEVSASEWATETSLAKRVGVYKQWYTYPEGKMPAGYLPTTEEWVKAHIVSPVQPSGPTAFTQITQLPTAKYVSVGGETVFTGKTSTDYALQNVFAENIEITAQFNSQAAVFAEKYSVAKPRLEISQAAWNASNITEVHKITGATDSYIILPTYYSRSLQKAVIAHELGHAAVLTLEQTPEGRALLISKGITKKSPSFIDYEMMKFGAAIPPTIYPTEVAAWQLARTTTKNPIDRLVLEVVRRKALKTYEKYKIAYLDYGDLAPNLEVTEPIHQTKEKPVGVKQLLKPQQINISAISFKTDIAQQEVVAPAPKAISYDPTQYLGIPYPKTRTRQQEEYETTFIDYPESGLMHPPILSKNITTNEYYRQSPSQYYGLSMFILPLLKEDTTETPSSKLIHIPFQIPSLPQMGERKEKITAKPNHTFLEITSPLNLQRSPVGSSFRLDQLNELMSWQESTQLSALILPYPQQQDTPPPLSLDFLNPRMPKALRYPSSPFDLPYGAGMGKGKKFNPYKALIWQYPVKGPKALMKELW